MSKTKAELEAERRSAEAEYLALQGQIESYEATINLRTVRAPFSGIAGLRNVFLGQYLKNGSDIVRLENISRMQMRFTIAQNDLNKIHIGQEMNVFVDAQPDTSFTGAILNRKTFGEIGVRWRSHNTIWTGLGFGRETSSVHHKSQ